MKLYLSSQKLGNYTEKLLELIGNNKKVAIIANALDDKPDDYRKDRVNKEVEMLKSIGLEPEELDLRDYFLDFIKLKDFLEDKSLIWIRGGNTFILNRAMIASNFDKIVKELIKENKIVYGGYSAALLIASKNLMGVDLIDNPYDIPEEYPKIDRDNDLNILDFYLIPHYGSEEEWAKNVPKHIEYLKEHNEEVITLKDGEVYYCENEGGILLRWCIVKKKKLKI